MQFVSAKFASKGRIDKGIKRIDCTLTYENTELYAAFSYENDFHDICNRILIGLDVKKLFDGSIDIKREQYEYFFVTDALAKGMTIERIIASFSKRISKLLF